MVHLTLYINGGEWKSTGTVNVNGTDYPYLLESADLGHGAGDGSIVVAGGQFPQGFDIANVVKSVGEYPNNTNTFVSATLADGYTYDVDTGTVSKECKHQSLLFVEQQDATTEKEGVKAHWLCSCGKKFSDVNGTKEVSDIDLVIPKLTDVGTGDKNPNVEDEVGSADTNTGSTSSSSSAAAAAPAASTEAKDETPKTGAISIVAVLAVVSIIGLAIIKRD